MRGLPDVRPLANQIISVAMSDFDTEEKPPVPLKEPSRNLSGDEAKARAAGCDGSIAKPFSPCELLAKVRKYLSDEASLLCAASVLRLP